MKIFVCVKQVPDTETRIKITGDNKSIETGDIHWILNPYDEFAVEEAVRIKEKNPGTMVTVISVGPERAASAMRTAIAMGADEAMLIKADELFLDPKSVAKAISEVLKDMEFDILFFGKQAVDDDSLQVGPRVAELLDLPCVTQVAELELKEGKAVARREIEGGTEVYEVSLPAIFTAEKGLNEPRYPALKGIMMAKRKQIEEKEAALDANSIEILKFEYPPAREGGKIVGEGADAVPELVKLLHEEANVI